MWNFRLTDLSDVLSATWPVLVIGLGTASLAFVVGWTTIIRRRRAATAAAAAAATVAATGERLPPGDPFINGPVNDRRSAARRGGHPVTVQLSDPDEKAAASTGWVVDRSVGGLCLMVPQPAPIGSFWKVRPADAPRTTPPVLVEVRTCVAAGGEWKLNCRFSRTPSYGVLLMFG
jgi:hypothetical protein